VKDIIKSHGKTNAAQEIELNERKKRHGRTWRSANSDEGTFGRQFDPLLKVEVLNTVNGHT